MDFPLYFKNKIWPGKGHFFCKKNLKSQTPKIYISFGGSMQKSQIKGCHLSLYLLNRRINSVDMDFLLVFCVILTFQLLQENQV